jgi:hypothetical protein
MRGLTLKSQPSLIHLVAISLRASIPDVTLTDALFKTVIWVDALKPDDWEQQMEDELGQVWTTQ